MHYNAEFSIIPYKLVACGIINEFAQGWLSVTLQEESHTIGLLSIQIEKYEKVFVIQMITVYTV